LDELEDERLGDFEVMYGLKAFGLDSTARDGGCGVADNVAMASTAEFPSGGEEDGLNSSALAVMVPTAGDACCVKGAEIAEGELISPFGSALTSRLADDTEGDDPRFVLLLLFRSFFPNSPAAGCFSRTGVLRLFSM
jgi:hypothetical protein